MVMFWNGSLHPICNPHHYDIHVYAHLSTYLPKGLKFSPHSLFEIISPPHPQPTYQPISNNLLAYAYLFTSYAMLTLIN